MADENIAYEEQLINILLNNKDSVKEFVTGCKIEYFDKSHEFLLSGIIWAFNEGVQLTRQSYKAFIDGVVKVPATAVAQTAAYNRCHMRITKKDDLPMLMAKVKEAYIRRMSIQYIKEYTKDRDQKGDLEANRILATKMMSLETNTSQAKTECVDIFSADFKKKFMEDLDYRAKNQIPRIICGIDEIDFTMSVGFKPGTLTIFCAAPGAFKTTIMMNVSLNIYHLSNVDTLFMPLEMPYEMMAQKIISRETRVPFDKIEHAEQLTDDEKRRIGDEFDKLNSQNNRFRLLKIADKTKLSVIRAEIDKRMSYFQPKIVVIDYVDNLIPDVRQSRNDLELRDMFDDMIKMGEYYGFAVITAAKLSRDALKRVREQRDGKQELDTTDIHGGQEFGGNATNIYGQLKNPNQPGSLLDFFCIKSRYGRNIFRGNKMKSSLKLRPEIGLIEGPQDATWTSEADNDAFKNTVNEVPPVDPPAEIKDDDPFA